MKTNGNKPTNRVAEKKAAIKEFNRRMEERNGPVPRTALAAILSRGSAVMSFPVSQAVSDETQSKAKG